MSTDAAATLVNDRVDALVAALQISTASARRYIDTDALAGLADSLTEMLADEKPGTNLMTEPRDVAVPAPMIGRAVAALSEALQLHLKSDVEANRDHAYELAQHLSMLGQMMSEGPGLLVLVPKALIHRISSQLDQAAKLPGTPRDLATAFHQDALRLRSRL
ncbi:hypothetical protein EB73_33865 [Mycobacterium sp. SWH-M3]|nr:hypothetical protein EB73_33865 [Mycobacterium sp. SWH-M3]